MRSKNYLLAAFGATLMITSYASSAQTLRCNGDIAQVGDSKASILQKCGRPAYEHSYCKPEKSTQSRRSADSSATVVPCETVDEWTYNPGPGHFLTNLKFLGGKVFEITYGDRVN